MTKRTLRADISALGFYLCLYLLLASMVGEILYAIAGFVGVLRYGPSNPEASWEFITRLSENTLFLLSVNALAQYICTMPVFAFIISKRIPTIAAREDLPAYYERPVQPAGRETPFSLRDLPAVFLMTACALEVGGWLGEIGGAIGSEIFQSDVGNEQLDVLLSGDTLLTIIFVVIMAPIAEELFFRKLIVDRLRPLGRRAAVITSALTFALYHQNIYQFFYALFFGLLSAWMYVKTEKLRYSILLHMFVNLTYGVIIPDLTADIETFDELFSAMTSPESALAFISGHAAAVITLTVAEIGALAGLVLFIIYCIRGKFHLDEAYGTLPFGTFLRALCTAPGMLLFTALCIAVNALVFLEVLA